MKKTPLYNKLIAYSEEKKPFHMPGHKFGSLKALSEIDLFKLDNTEAEGMDNLYEAEGVIAEAMQLMAEFYGAKHSMFITNGSTTGILASMLAVCKEGDKFIVARNAHHSVWSALTLAGVTPVYISPEYITEDDLLGQVSVSKVKEALELYPEVKGAIIVSPTYEGIVSNIKEIADVLHEKNKVLIVDEAHGAHFVLEGVFPLSSIKCGADLVINSTHKTLPALTQSALLHICSDRIRLEEVISCVRMVQTSSPSYVMMGLMDYVRDYLIENKEMIYLDYMKPLQEVREQLAQLRHLRLINKAPAFYDIGKIIISTKSASISGYELAELLNQKYAITVEAALETYIILMTTVADTNESLRELVGALIEIDSSLNHANASSVSVNDFMEQEITIGKNSRKIHYSDKCYCRIEESLGKTAAKNVMLYPPGIPIVCIGETIGEKHISLIEQFKSKVQGIKLKQDVIYINICNELV